VAPEEILPSSTKEAEIKEAGKSREVRSAVRVPKTCSMGVELRMSGFLA
jgi:hypothetical protein